MEEFRSISIQWQCQQLINRVTNLLDQGRWEELAQCYTEDAVLFRPSDPNHGVEGRDAILQSFADRPSRTTCHLLGNTFFDVQSEHRVVATSRVWLISGPDSATHPVLAEQKILAGSFIDTLVNTGGQWLIQLRRGSIELKYGD